MIHNNFEESPLFRRPGEAACRKLVDEGTYPVTAKHVAEADRVRAQLHTDYGLPPIDKSY